jgi:hypothetical protein
MRTKGNKTLQRKGRFEAPGQLRATGEQWLSLDAAGREAGANMEQHGLDSGGAPHCAHARWLRPLLCASTMPVHFSYLLDTEEIPAVGSPKA